MSIGTNTEPAGYRLTLKRKMQGWTRLEDGTIVPPAQSHLVQLPASVAKLHVVHQESDTEISTRIAERFDVLVMLTTACIVGAARSLIISGPPGLGKSYTVENMFQEIDPTEINHTIVRGNIRATGLYKLLYDHREKGQVLIFDDADAIFYDEISLGLLKAVCDTTDRRQVCWRTEGSMISEKTAEVIPKKFDFEGTIIFISNINFDERIEKNDKLAPHLAALISRSHFIDLGMRSRRDYFVRIKQVLTSGLLSSKGYDEFAEKEIVDFIEQNISKLRELSLRTALKIAALYSSKNDWRKIAKITTCKN